MNPIHIVAARVVKQYLKNASRLLPIDEETLKSFSSRFANALHKFLDIKGYRNQTTSSKDWRAFFYQFLRRSNVKNKLEMTNVKGEPISIEIAFQRETNPANASYNEFIEGARIFTGKQSRIELTLVERPLPSLAEKLEKPTGRKNFAREMFHFLSHEITHALDIYDPNKYDPKEYYNNPTEVKAHARD